MRLFFADVMDRFDQRALRERVLVLLALLGLIGALWDTILMQPLERDRKVLKQQVEMMRAEVSGLEKSIEKLAAQGVADPDAASRATVARLQAEIAETDAKLAGATAGLIAPKEMAQVLGQVLSRTSHLTLLSLRTLPPEAVMAPLLGDAVLPTAAAAGRPGATPPPTVRATQIYKHGVEIEVAGSYLEILHFLQSLEALPWRFFWDHVEYTVEQHPQGKLKLVLYTLGLQEGWVGV